MRNARPAGKHRHIGHETNIAHEPVALGPGVAAEHSQFSLIWGKAENRIERRGLACAVRADQSEYAAFFHAQVHAIQCESYAEGLAQAACLYACHGFSGPPCR